jgi:peptidoglycan/xylan/chitin deacetylase (PgdA/CDA1 family)
MHLNKLFISSLCAIGSVGTSAAPQRPAQFVLLAFDNCQENQSWRQVSEFLEEMNARKSDNLRFTFFLSAVGLVTNQAKTAYLPPDRPAGRSNINFGGSQAEVLERIAHINTLHARGNEIASHAVGHFDGSQWGPREWRHEMEQYNRIIDKTAEVNGFTGDVADRARLRFKSSSLMGFRAPYLAGPAALIDTLAGLNYAYDTSDTNQGGDPRTWPRRYKLSGGRPGPWNFGLGFINVPGITDSAGRALKIPAMDYNFCYRQDKGCPEKYPDTLRTIERDSYNMLSAYLNYFVTNYNGNRAPVHIGHHFQQYRGGYYNRALMRFARTVCSLPEVRCTTYAELTKFMNGTSDSERADYQRALFDKASYRPTLDELLKKSESH